MSNPQEKLEQFNQLDSFDKRMISERLGFSLHDSDHTIADALDGCGMEINELVD